VSMIGSPTPPRLTTSETMEMEPTSGVGDAVGTRVGTTVGACVRRRGREAPYAACSRSSHGGEVEEMWEETYHSRNQARRLGGAL
jgi:hypothetical protein